MHSSPTRRARAVSAEREFLDSIGCGQAALDSARAVQERIDASRHNPVPQPDLVRELGLDELTRAECVALFGTGFADTQPMGLAQ